MRADALPVVGACATAAVDGDVRRILLDSVADDTAYGEGVATDGGLTQVGGFGFEARDGCLCRANGLGDIGLSHVSRVSSLHEIADESGIFVDEIARDAVVSRVRVFSEEFVQVHVVHRPNMSSMRYYCRPFDSGCQFGNDSWTDLRGPPLIEAMLSLVDVLVLFSQTPFSLIFVSQVQGQEHFWSEVGFSEVEPQESMIFSNSEAAAQARFEDVRVTTGLADDTFPLGVVEVEIANLRSLEQMIQLGDEESPVGIGHVEPGANLAQRVDNVGFPVEIWLRMLPGSSILARADSRRLSESTHTLSPRLPDQPRRRAWGLLGLCEYQ